MSLDQVEEKVNLTAKQMLYGCPTRERIAQVVSNLNFLWPLERAYQRCTGVYEDKAEDGPGVDFTNDAAIIARFLCNLFMRNRYEMSRPSNINALTGTRFNASFLPSMAIDNSSWKAEWGPWIDGRMACRRF